MMVGRPLNDSFNKDRTIPKGDMVLECTDLTDEDKVLSGTLNVRAVRSSAVRSGRRRPL